MNETSSISADYAEVNGARLYYEVAGEGHPLVLIHAGIADSRMWNAQFAAFAQSYHVIRYDMRGFGKSAMVAGAFSHHADLAALLQFLAIKQAYLVGISLGSRTALSFALTCPDMADALIITGSAGLGAAPGESLLQKWDEVDALVEIGDNAGAVELEVQMWVDGPHRQPDQVNPAIRELVREMDTIPFSYPPNLGDEQLLDPRPATRLAEIHIPTMVIVGEQDQPDILASSDYLAAGIHSAQKVILLASAHLPNMEQPEEFNRIVLNFLSKL